MMKDWTSGEGIYNLGRRPQVVVEALKAGLQESDQGNFPMISDDKGALAQRLVEFVPEGLDTVLFNAMRGEALDAACKVARGATGRHELVTVSGNWFGETGFALSLSTRADKEDYGPLVPGTRIVSRDAHGALAKVLSKGAAALVVEPVQVENGMGTVSYSLLAEYRRLCDRYGVMLIFDETWTACGRCGERTFAALSGVVPDALVLGEAVTGGVFPLTAVVFNRRGRDFLNSHPLIHLSTFGGSDLGCRAGLAALDEYDRLRPWTNVRKQAQAFFEGLAQTAETFAFLRGRDGLGLLWAVRTTSAATAGRLVEALARNGYRTRRGRIAADTVLLCPELLLTEEAIEHVMTTLNRACRQVSEDL